MMKNPLKQYGAPESNRVIYYSSKMTKYLVLLLTSKLTLAFSYFIVYDLLKTVHVVQFLFLSKMLVSLFVVLLQKPFTSGKPISRLQWFGIVRHSLAQTLVHSIWLYGLTLCGPLRTILLFEHKAIVVIAGASALFTGVGGHSKLRGAICFIVGILGLLFLDHDDEMIVPTEHPEGQYHHGISHIFYFLFNWLGLADHKAGVLLIVLVLCFQTIFQNSARHLSVDIGGAKRLYALSTLASTCFLTPWALFLQITDQTSSSITWSSLLVPVMIGGIVFFVIDYYVEAACISRLDASFTAKFGSLGIFGSALLLTLLWETNILSSTRPLIISGLQHGLSGGVLFSWFMFTIASFILSGITKTGTKGNFVGYSAAGLPLYSFNIPGNPQSTFQVLKGGLIQILKENDSKKIFYFLCLNLTFTFVELVYGIWANSLGLISDGFHMLFDCSALLLGLCASLLARKKSSKTFPYGYGRVEVLSGFVNGLFLIVVAIMVFTEAVSRLFEPPKILTEKLLTVSVLGLIINFIGIVVFRHAHSHSHSHGHSNHNHSHNANMQGVFLHILADTLGSVGVIVSSFVIDKFGLFVADPLCSLFISGLIFLSVLPLLKYSSQILLLRAPASKETHIQKALSKVSDIDGVLSYNSQHFWEQTPGNLIGSLNVQVKQETSEQKVIAQVQTIFKEIGFSQFTVQVENEKYYQFLSGLGHTKQIKTVPYPNQTIINNFPSSIKFI